MWQTVLAKMTPELFGRIAIPIAMVLGVVSWVAQNKSKMKEDREKSKIAHEEFRLNHPVASILVKIIFRNRYRTGCLVEMVFGGRG
jgi:hypothetical protein